MMPKEITIDDLKYPRLLKTIPSPPERIYYKGRWDVSVFENCLAVVGSRRMTTYGKQVTAKLVSEISMAGVTVISGFMYGIDAAAHKAAVDSGGRTVAVMPCGIDLVHPWHQKSLYNEILSNNGLIISEFSGSFPPATWTYPKRNRIVAGLSRATLVIEAGKKSGSLITANLAKSYKRRLLAVPGPITSTNSEGIFQLIREGAEIAISPQDVLKIYGKKSPVSDKNRLKPSGLSRLEELVLESLRRAPMSIDELSRVAKTTASQISTVLSLMQLKGWVAEEEGKFYSKLIKSG